MWSWPLHGLLPFTKLKPPTVEMPAPLGIGVLAALGANNKTHPCRLRARDEN